MSFNVCPQPSSTASRTQRASRAKLVFPHFVIISVVQNVISAQSSSTFPVFNDMFLKLWIWLKLYRAILSLATSSGFSIWSQLRTIIVTQQPYFLYQYHHFCIDTWAPHWAQPFEQFELHLPASSQILFVLFNIKHSMVCRIISCILYLVAIWTVFIGFHAHCWKLRNGLFRITATIYPRFSPQNVHKRCSPSSRRNLLINCTMAIDYLVNTAPDSLRQMISIRVP